jgi:hypothetical protein
MSSLAKKVWDSVPSESSWPISKIQNDLFRKGCNQVQNKVASVLDQMTEVGIVKEDGKGHFCRVVITSQKQDKLIQDEKTKGDEMILKTDSLVKPKDLALAKDANPFNGLREISIKLLDLAKDIDAFVSHAEQQMKENSKDTEKLKQLQALLKGI